MLDTPCFHYLATSPECHVDIFVDFIPQRGLILSFVNVNINILHWIQLIYVPTVSISCVGSQIKMNLTVPICNVTELENLADELKGRQVLVSWRIKTK